MKKSNYIIFDTETGGLNPSENPITSFAAVVLDFNTLKEVNRWETYVKPYNGLQITKESISKTMVNMAEVSRGMELDAFIEALGRFCTQNFSDAKGKEQRRLIGVGHNVMFDVAMLSAAFEYSSYGRKYDLFTYIQEQTLDTMYFSKMMYGLTGDEKMTLGATCERAGIRLTDAHGAMNDVEATAEYFRYCIQRLRAGGEITATERKKRRRGNDFFEFQCAK